MTTEAGFNPDDFSGFTKHTLEIFERFRDVAVDEAIASGNLDGTGSNPLVNAHIKGVVDANTLLNQYELPVVMSVPLGSTDQGRNIASADTDYRFAVSAWVSDYNQAYGLEFATVIIGNVVNNIEDNRTLQSPSGGDPLARDTRLDGTNSITWDFALNVDQNFHLKFCTANFRIKTKRPLP